MNWFAALATGAGLGLVYFFGLWWSVRQLLRSPGRRGWVVGGRIVRISVAGLGFLALSQFGGQVVVVGLTGFWFARWHLLRRLGGVHDD
jgi:F1F0 ATPase subunit 2